MLLTYQSKGKAYATRCRVQVRLNVERGQYTLSVFGRNGRRLPEGGDWKFDGEVVLSECYLVLDAK